MKILVGSDYHGDAQLQAEALRQIPGVDVYINCGDFCTWAGAKPDAQTSGYHPRGAEEVQQLQQFFTAVDQLAKPWLFVPGNHDPSASVLAEMARPWQHGRFVTQSELVWLWGLRVLAVPYTPPCGWNWTLTKPHLDELVAQYQNSTVDLLITHAPPKGVLDEESRWYHRKTPTLRPLVDLLNPRYYLCGHMHLDGGKTETQGQTTFINAALHNLLLEI